jgi:hypothetical protein
MQKTLKFRTSGKVPAFGCRPPLTTSWSAWMLLPIEGKKPAKKAAKSERSTKRKAG